MNIANKLYTYVCSRTYACMCACCYVCFDHFLLNSFLEPFECCKAHLVRLSTVKVQVRSILLIELIDAKHINKEPVWNYTGDKRETNTAPKK